MTRPEKTETVRRTPQTALAPRRSAPVRHRVLAALCAAMVFTAAPQPASAQLCQADLPNEAQTIIVIEAINSYTTARFIQHRVWMVEVFFKQAILPAMQLMTEQMTAIAMQQMQILGTFFDAKHQLETERLYQQLAAQAHKDYHVSAGLCTLGTNMRSLAISNMDADMAGRAMAQYSMDRQLLSAGHSSAEGIDGERQSRVRQFRKTFCNPNDNNRMMSAICEGNIPQSRMNKDIDYVRTVGLPLTIDADFSDTATSPDKEDLIALQKNLYSNAVYEKINDSALRDDGNLQLYMDMRSIVAKRGVAENSFHAIAGMKTAGVSDGAETARYMAAVLQELGVPAAEASRMVGRNPSYYAQMEILTKSVLQRPQFFVDLYDKPANVARKSLALQTLSVMQGRDGFKSTLRSEALLSLILELELMKEQDALQNEENRMQ